MDPSIPREVGNPHDPDTDPLETREWIDALDALIAAEGPERATFLLRRLLQHARARRVPLPQVLATPYVNTIGLAEQCDHDEIGERRHDLRKVRQATPRDHHGADEDQRVEEGRGDESGGVVSVRRERVDHDGKPHCP